MSRNDNAESASISTRYLTITLELSLSSSVGQYSDCRLFYTSNNDNFVGPPLQSDQNLRGPHVARQQQLSVDICCPRPTSAANPPSAVAAVDRWDRRTNRRTGQTARRTLNRFMTLTAQLGSRVVSVLDSGAEGPGFNSQSRRCRATVLGKLFTPIVPVFTTQQNW